MVYSNKLDLLLTLTMTYSTFSLLLTLDFPRESRNLGKEPRIIITPHSIQRYQSCGLFMAIEVLICRGNTMIMSDT